MLIENNQCCCVTVVWLRYSLLVCMYAGFLCGEHEALEGTLGQTALQGTRTPVPDGAGSSQ